jgi:hypothetical protein
MSFPGLGTAGQKRAVFWDGSKWTVASPLVIPQFTAETAFVGPRLDSASGAIVIGDVVATSVALGRAGVTVNVPGTLTIASAKVQRAPTKFFVPGISGRQQTTQLGPDEVGALVFDPSAFVAGDANLTRTFRFAAVLECNVGGQSCALELYNITDGVTVTTLTTSNTTPTLRTATLTSPADLPNSEKVYGLRLTRTGGGVTDPVTCKLARLEVIYS